MDDEPRQQPLSLIPYSPSGEAQVVLRRGSAVVLYDPRSKAITLREARKAPGDESCPYCHRPFQASHGADDGHGPLSPHDEAAFMDPSYFRMLNHSRDNSRQASRSQSPKRLAPPSKPVVEDLHGSRTSTPDHSASSQHISSDAFSPNYFKTFFAEEAELGRGGNGVVLLVRHYIGGVDLGLFACKRIPVGNDRSWLRKVLVEVQLLQTLSHQNLVSYKHVWLENFETTSFGPSVPCAFILQQYCNAGDLHRYILGSQHEMTNEQLKHRARARSKGQLEPIVDLGRPRHLPFEEIFSFFRDIASGLNYLHTRGYIHRDLKPSNCLLHRTGSQIRCLLSDFGETQGAGVVRESTGNTGTISFCAPEVLTWDHQTGSYGNFTEKSDIFSLGLIVHLMCFNRLPYAGADTASGEADDVEQLRAEISAWVGWTGSGERKERTDLPDQLYKYLKLLLSLNPEERPGTDEILQGIKGFHEQARTKPSNYSRHSTEPDIRMRSKDVQEEKSPRALTDLQRRGSGIGSSWRHPQESPAREVSPISRSTIIQRRKAGRSPPRPQSPETPRLMPPPSHSRRDLILRTLLRPELTAAAKLSLFAVKVWTLTTPCTPFLVKAPILYTLLGVAALDLFGVYKSPRWTISLALAHFLVIVAAYRLNSLCIIAPLS